MLKIIFLLCGLVAYGGALPAPQDMQDLQMAAMLAAGQLKEVLETGGGARDKKTFEMFGGKVTNDMGIGFGDAMKSPFRRRRREVLGTDDDNDNDDDDYSSSEYDDSDSDEDEV